MALLWVLLHESLGDPWEWSVIDRIHMMCLLIGIPGGCNHVTFLVL